MGRVGVDEGQLLVERGDGPDDADRVHGVEEGEHQQFVRRNDLPHLRPLEFGQTSLFFHAVRVDFAVLIHVLCCDLDVVIVELVR